MEIALLMSGDPAINVKNISEQISSIYLEDNLVYGLCGNLKKIDSDKFTRLYRINFNNRLVLFLDLYKYVKNNDLDVLIQLTAPHKTGPMAAIIGRMTGTKTITRLSGDTFRLRRYNLGGLEKKLMNFYQKGMFLAEKVIAPSPYLKKELISHGCPRRKIVILPQPLDRKRFRPPEKKREVKKELGFSLSRKNILFVGRLEKRKGVPTLLRAAKEMKGYLFHLIGDGTLLKRAQKFGNVLCHGQVPHKDVHKFFQASDVYFHPSHFEGLSNSILEAKACGVPVLARDKPGIDWLADEVFSKENKIPNQIKNLVGQHPKPLPEIFENKNLEEKYRGLLEDC